MSNSANTHAALAREGFEGRRLVAALLAFVAALLAFVAILLGATPILAQSVPGVQSAHAERIQSFDAQITVLRDGAVNVREHITVTATGDKIKHGIYRDIPTVLKNADGTLLRPRFEILAVKVGGSPAPYRTESIENGIRIYIGSATVFLAPGTYRYTIAYSMSRQARRFENYDEIYWNVTGNDWDFPIDRANATISLPEGAKPIELHGYTGPLDSSEQAVSITRLNDGRLGFATTRPLARHEGLTISATFEKGSLAPLSNFERAFFYLSDHRDVILSVTGVLIVLLYNFFAWDAVGRDPAKGTIIPRFYPPKGFSPALAHFVHHMGWRSSAWSAFSAALVDMAVRGLITINAKSKKNIVIGTSGRHPSDLPAGEQAIFDVVRAHPDLHINKQNGPLFNRARRAFVQAIEDENRFLYFHNNTAYVVFGAVLGLAVLAVLYLSGVLAPFWLFASIVTGIALGLFAAALRTGGLREMLGFRRLVILFWSGVIIANFAAALGASYMLLNSIASVPVVAAISIVLIMVVFAILMRAPTVQGRKVMDEIEGFRMYLETAEKERLNFDGEPRMTVSRFEGILPYAMALGVEKPWSERFERDLARHAVDGLQPGQTYHPVWYSGVHMPAGSWGSQVAAIGAGLSAAMISAQPVSSSGSGGGGSSGGGGGGGGGGGW